MVARAAFDLLQCFVSMVCDKHCYLNRCVTPGAPRDVVVGEAGMVRAPPRCMKLFWQAISMLAASRSDLVF